jgi:transmembrane sensor
MTMSAKMLEALLRKYLDDESSPGELRLLRELSLQKENQAELDRLLALWIDREFPFPQQEDIDIDTLYLELTRNKDIPMGVEQAELVRSGRRVLLSCVSAAACVLLAAGLFLLMRPSRSTISSITQTVVVPAAAIGPAGGKAVLTLADGQRIVLDSAANGKLASQGAIQVIKLGSGQLAYRPAKGGDGVIVKAGLSDPLPYDEIATPRGGFYQLILSDGSKVWLDAASSLRFPATFSGAERLVELNGEAYFEIAPNKDHPFMITTQGVTVQVLGTELNLMAYQDEDAIRTTLVSGSVRVMRGKDLRQIRPGEQASWQHDNKSWQVSTPDMRQVLAWKRLEFRFEGLSMEAIMRQIGRWYDVDIAFRGPQPAGEFNGVISRKKTVTDLLAALEETDMVHFTLEDRRITVEAGPRPAGH